MRIVKDIAAYLRGQLQLVTSAVVPANAPVTILAIGTPAVVAPLDTTTKNTAIKYSIGDYIGTVFYDRVDATAWWTKNVPSNVTTRKLVIRSNRMASIYDILSDINKYTRLQLTESELVNTPIADGVVNTITLTFTEQAVWFTGTLTLTLEYPVYVSGGNVIKSAEYTATLLHNGIIPGQDTSGKYNPGLLTYDNDYSANTASLLAIDAAPVASWESAYVVNSTNANTIIAALKAVDGLPWVYNTSARAPFNLYGSQIVYNGPVDGFIQQMMVGLLFNSHGLMTDRVKLPRADKQFVMAILVSSPTSNTAIGSTNMTLDPIFIHYGNDILAESPDKPPVHHWPLNDDRRNYGTSETQPDFAVSGKFLSVAETSETGLVPDYYYSTNFSSGGSYYIGTDLPVDKDYTIYFELSLYEQGIDASLAASLILQLYDWSTPSELLGRVYVNTDTASQIMQKPTINGTWSLSATRRASVGAWFPHWSCIAISRRGQWWYVYVNGQIAAMHKGTTVLTKLNALWLPTNVGNCIRNFKYFDYGLSGDQIKRQDESIFNKPKVAKSATLPIPLHRWPLDGTLVNKGSSTTPLANIFGFRECAATRPGKWAYRAFTDAASKALGVDLPIDKDFTLAFDFFTSNANAGYYSSFLMGGYTDNTGHLLKFAGTLPFIENATWQPYSLLTHRQIPVNGTHRITITRDNGWFKCYVDGVVYWAARATKSEVPAWNRFGYVANAHMDSSASFRNLTYYDRALSCDEVMLDVTKEWQ